MAVKADISGNSLTMTVSVDVADINKLVGVSTTEKHKKMFELCRQEIQESADHLNVENLAIDVQTTEEIAQIEKRAVRIKSAKATGTLVDNKPDKQ